MNMFEGADYIDEARAAAKAALAVAKKRKALARAYQDVFDSGAGKLVLHDLMREADIFAPATCDGDPYRTHFNDGRRSLALHILQRLRWSEGEMLALAREQTAERLTQGAE